MVDVSPALPFKLQFGFVFVDTDIFLRIIATICQHTCTLFILSDFLISFFNKYRLSREARYKGHNMFSLDPFFFQLFYFLLLLYFTLQYCIGFTIH